MQYTAVIRTLGKAGEKYQILLDTLMKQTIAPKDIIVYIAEGYDIPTETIGVERYVYVKKGMVAQRALPYDEVETEYILFLDDDLYFPNDGVEKLYDALLKNDAEVVSPDVFENAKISASDKIRMAFLGLNLPLFREKKYAYKVLRGGGFSYNNNPIKPVYESTTNAGPCFFCKKEDFLKIRFEEELWLDETFYALPEDQVMFYKMHLCGLKILTLFDSGIIHLDAGSTNQGNALKKLNNLYSESRNKLIFWHRFIFLCENNLFFRLWSILCIAYVYFIRISVMCLKLQRRELGVWLAGMKSAYKFLKSDDYIKIKRVQ